MVLKRNIVACALILAVAPLGRAGAAELKNYVFGGNIESVENPTGFFDDSIKVGDPFAMTVTIPSDTPNTFGSSQVFGEYDFPEAPGVGESLTVNGHAVPLGPPQKLPGVPSSGEIRVNSVSGNGDSFYGHQFFKANDPNISEVRLDFGLSSNAHPLGDTALPDVVDLADFPVNPLFSLQVFYRDNRAYPEIWGHITSVQAFSTPIPEPGSGLVFGLAVAGYIGSRYRRQCRVAR